MASHARMHGFDAPGTYLILVQGRLAVGAPYLDDMTVTASYDQEGVPVTLLSGSLVDQAALMGILTALYDRGLTVLSVNRVAHA